MCECATVHDSCGAGCVDRSLLQVSREAIEKRYSQGWLLEVIDNLDSLVARIRDARARRRPASIGYHGNVVLVWYASLELSCHGKLVATQTWWLGSRVVSVLDSGAKGPGSNRSRDAVR